MRIRSVALEGFGPFKERQVVDFRAFDTDGLFLIAGETGAGKSSILDGIAYALYNKTPRWDNVSGTGASNAVRSDFCGVDDLTEAVVEFETNGDEYRVSRSPEYDRPKARGEGVTRQASKILVEVLEGTSWVGKATKEREAAELIEGLLKLNKDEFLQVIMLAQGRFQEFLLANSEQRLDLLSKLFGTKRFADYQAKISERRSVLNRKVESARGQRTMLLGGVNAPEELGEPQPGHELEWLQAVTESAGTELSISENAVRAADNAEKAALDQLDTAKRQARLQTANTALALLSSKQKSMDETKANLASAERAERVRPLLDDAVGRSEEWESAKSDVEQKRLGYTGTAGDDALAAEVTRLTEEIGTLADALEDEERAEQLDSDIAKKSKEFEEFAELLAKLTKSIEDIQLERAKLVPVAAQKKPAADKVEYSKARLAAAGEAQEITAQLRSAQEVQLAADKALTAARLTAENVLDRFLHGQAAVLAKTLVDGEPCAVCGSLEHPLPASFSGEAVSQEDVDTAQTTVVRLEPAAKSAKQKVDELTVAEAKLTGAAGASDVDTLAAAATQAENDLKAATSAESRILKIDKQLSDDDGLLAERKKAEAAARTCSDDLNGLKTDRTGLNKKLARLRDEHPTVRSRYEQTVVARNGAQQLTDAIATFITATKQRTSADTKLDAKLQREEFQSVDDVRNALLNDKTVAELRQQIDSHAAAVSENQGILKQPDLQNLPEIVIEVDAASAAHLDSQRATRAATSSKANAETTLNQLGSKRSDLETLLTETDELIAEYEIPHRLAETVNGRTPNTRSMSLESYYLAAELEDVLTAANVRLRTLSHGRFEFRHTERGIRRANVAAGLEIEVFDEYTGTARPANQLSGGQQFLASLALALGLAEVVTSRAGGIELNTLFVDEGFGGLSDEYLEIAMETLDSLKQGGRTVGVISHVNSMQEQIGAQLRVVAQPSGPSEVIQAEV